MFPFKMFKLSVTWTKKGVHDVFSETTQIASFISHSLSVSFILVTIHWCSASLPPAKTFQPLRFAYEHDASVVELHVSFQACS